MPTLLKRTRPRQVDCPICRRDALDVTPRGYHGLVVSCPRCGRYRIMREVLGTVRMFDVDKRLAALEKAKRLASAPVWPTISRGCLAVVVAVGLVTAM